MINDILYFNNEDYNSELEYIILLHIVKECLWL